MGKTAAADDILQFIVTTEAITGKVPGESFQEFFRMVSAPAGLIIIQTDRRQPVISGAIQPHIGLGLCRFPFLLQYLAGCFICMDDVPLQQMPVKLFMVLAEKSRAGHTAEVRALLVKHGADKLSDIDPTRYPALLADAEAL